MCTVAGQWQCTVPITSEIVQSSQPNDQLLLLLRKLCGFTSNIRVVRAVESSLNVRQLTGVLPVNVGFDAGCVRVPAGASVFSQPSQKYHPSRIQISRFKYTNTVKVTQKGKVSDQWLLGWWNCERTLYYYDVVKLNLRLQTSVSREDLWQ